METQKTNSPKKERIANILFRLDAIKFGVFKLSNGKASPYYVDLRVIPSFPDSFKEICDSYTEYITSQIGLKNFDRIAGIPIAGIPFASQVAYNLKKPFLYVRKGIRTHERERRVEGILVSGDRVLLIDDLLTTGLTSKEAAGSLRAEGGIVAETVVFLDREEGGKQLLEKNTIKLHSILKISEIAKTLFEMGAIDKENLKTILKQTRKQ